MTHGKSIKRQPTGADYAAVIEAARERRAKALALHNAGKTYQEIADRWGITKQRVGELIGRARREAKAVG